MTAFRIHDLNTPTGQAWEVPDDAAGVGRDDNGDANAVEADETGNEGVQFVRVELFCLRAWLKLFYHPILPY